MKRQFYDDNTVIISPGSAGQTYPGFIEPSPKFSLQRSETKRQQQQQQTLKPPPRYIPESEAEVIPTSTLEMLQCIERPDSMMIDDVFQSPDPALKFIFFLGVQGKEFIETIQEKFPENISVMFITANEPNHCSNQQCHILANHFQIMDPVGGGTYPLDYLYVVYDDKVHCKLPLITNPQNKFQRSISRANKKPYAGMGVGVSQHLNFGIELNDLPSIIEEYINFF
ncbi:uncharacterized protein SPAPADRAFT_63604 [Spathaspora passalidarum NRRL Y-27907]|uniref:Uncharacterized protein n=1 Tax=Spathaspora passalidarum (strain NRRL Y-27907 / 11-Y1) TaxID=619300 RepID=G3AVT4_SPAPN|nr:uncharacterized protein SPAPADRAFT_63604 [Spathaspora passalidarum NRRL Y-27907]EGW29979.1 hypothetical protein SPAPADRAFT_63604 [Spathaspora passalidarum NRRL Y-27907]